jgi:hypothetical protein
LFGAADGTLTRHGLIAEEGVARVLQVLAERFDGNRHDRRLPALDLTVTETLFGREVHRPLIDAEAIEEVEPGGLDLNPALRGFRTLRPSATLESTPSSCGFVRRTPARTTRPMSHSRTTLSSGHQIVTQKDEELDY